MAAADLLRAASPDRRLSSTPVVGEVHDQLQWDLRDEVHGQ
eukprot:gene32437-10649_t